jgi:putative membrane-bound dehydrogenase-like protein
MKNYLVLFLGIVLSSGFVHSAEPEASSEQLPGLVPTEARDAMKAFRLKKGFNIELAAAEPQVVDPVSMSFDADGRLYVVEMIGYSEHRDDKLGRVRLLEDTNDDGRFDKATVYAKGLAWPTAVICYDGGVFVAVTPDLLYFRDTNGDGVADQRRVVYTGFGKERSRLNMQGLPNSLRWGLDNRIHAVTSSNGAVLTRPDDDSLKPIRLNGRDFSFDPRTLDLRPESGGGQHGASFDDYGRRFVSSNSNHLQAIVFDSRYAANSRYAMPSPRLGIAVDGSAAEVFRISPDEPWRIVRTRWRIASKVRGPVEGGGRVSGYFTAATGVAIYRGDAFGAGFRGNAFVADAGSNLVHRKVLNYEDGIVPVGKRPEDERSSEFLASTDNWFRPVQLANGPDGCFYVLDMYREVIEHPWSLPSGIKKHIDLDSGNDRGRIWRIVPEGFVRPPSPRFGNVSSPELVAILSSPNAWRRETSARLLYEGQDAKAVPALLKLAMEGESHLGRLHALYALAGLDQLKPNHLVMAMSDRHPFLREHAIRLAEPFLVKDINSSRPLAQAMLALARDKSPHVRLQFALTSGVVEFPGELPALLETLAVSGKDSWIRSAVLNALSAQVNELFSHYADSVPPPDASEVVALANGLRKGGNSLSRLQPEARKYLQRVSMAVVEDADCSSALRLQAIGLLSTLDKKAASPPLLAFLDATEASLRDGAVRELVNLAPEGLTADLLDRWKVLSPGSRDEAIGYLLEVSERTNDLLDAMEKGVVAITDLQAVRLTALRNLKDDIFRKRAVELVGLAPPEKETIPREKVIESYLPALRLAGDSTRGRVTYVQRCASCHRAGKEGHALGPDLVALKAAGPEKLLTNLIDPSREVAADFVAYEVRGPKDKLFGLLANETTTHLTIRFPLGKSVTLLRKEVDGMKSLGRSLMPEGLEAGLDQQAMADLLAFLAHPEPDHRLPPFDLLIFADEVGGQRPVRSREDWEKRRKSILEGAEKVMGTYPVVKKRTPLDLKIIESKDAGTYLLQSITYQSSASSGVPAHLCIPKDVLSGKRKAKAILCLHPTDNKVGREVVLGLGGRANRAYAAELAERGFVTIAPAYPLLADYQPDVAKLGYASGTMKAVWDNSRALDLLESLSYVDASNGFGVIGHSLGGHNAIFTATFEKRISAIAVSCSFDSFPDYYDGNEKNWVFGKGWCQTRYMPRLSDYRGRLGEIPFDFPELLGALAPRHLFVSAPKGDHNFRWESARRCTEAASKVYSLLESKGNLVVRHPECAHDFPLAIREAAYDFLAKGLARKEN